MGKPGPAPAVEEGERERRGYEEATETGHRWQRTSAPVASSRTDDIWFLDADRGWAVNSNGHILHTPDGGETWQRQFSASGAYLRCVGFANERVGWVGSLTEPTRLFHTSDGGASWALVDNLPPDAPPAICGLSIVSERVVYGSGTNFPDRPAGVVKTVDGGATWTAMDLGEHATLLVDIFFRDEQRGWVVGGKADVPNPDREDVTPVVLFTEDGGQTWENRLAGADGELPKGEWGWKIQFLDDEVGFAREEMGHLMTVQNLLLLLGLPPDFEREDFPPRKDLYPFSLHLEPLSQRSLAKYVVAEGPAVAGGIDDIIDLARESAGAEVNRVGVLYGLLGLIFATERQVGEGGSGSEDWDEIVSQLAQAAYDQAPADGWHLPDSAFHSETVTQQADHEDWQVGDLRVHRIADRAAAALAICDIGEQGEGPTNEGARSHFERFLGVYRGQGGMAAFPAAGEWVPTREVPTDPAVDADITEPRAKRWAELVDIRYALLLGFLEHYLLTAGEDRSLLTGWIFAEMRSRVGYMSRRLTAMPRGGEGTTVAAVPFTLPPALHLPAGKTARWAVHRERTEAAIVKVGEMQEADAVDHADPYLVGLLASDPARLAFIAAATPGPGAMTSFARDIMPLFSPKDIQHMRNIGLDLSQYETVRASAQAVSRRVGATGGRPMPPAPDQRWTKAQLDLFERWIAEGFPE